MPAPRRVAVIGGGIAGLAAAHYLTRDGCDVEVFEATERLGGLGASFERDGRVFERFYHVMLPSDEHLLGMLEETGLGDRPYWTDSSMGFMHRSRRFALNTPLDLLRFGVLPFHDRLRVAFTGLYGTLLRNGDALDHISAEQWLTRLSGRRAFARFWRPLLEAKFGAAYEQIPARWFWTRFQREKGGKKEVKGYPRGGYEALARGLADSVKGRGGRIHVSTPVQSLTLDGVGRPTLDTVLGRDTFDQAVTTLPLAQLRSVAEGQLAGRVDEVHNDIDYQGVVNVVLMLRQSVISDYWMPVLESGAPFQGIVEATRVIDRAETGGATLVYLMNYVHRTDPLFHRDPAEIGREYFSALLRLFPHLEPDDLLEARTFRAPFVEPIYTLGYEASRPPSELVPGRVFLATTAQVYPGVTSWNGSTGLAKEVVGQMTARWSATPVEGTVGASP